MGRHNHLNLGLVTFGIKEEKSSVVSLMPFDWIFEESDEEDEGIYDNILTEE